MGKKEMVPDASKIWTEQSERWSICELIWREFGRFRHMAKIRIVFKMVNLICIGGIERSLKDDSHVHERGQCRRCKFGVHR